MRVTLAVVGMPQGGNAYAPGEAIRYALTVTNDGGVALRDITLRNRLPGAEIEVGAGYAANAGGWAEIGLLEPGASATVAASYAVTRADALAGRVVNAALAAAVSSDPGAPQLRAESDEVEVQTEASYALTVRYWLGAAGGEVAAESFTGSYLAGETYRVASPAIPGYAPDRGAVVGEMPARDLTIDVIYAPVSYALTVRYVYLDGAQAAPPRAQELAAGTRYSVESPVIEGYAANPTLVEGVMPARDLVRTVLYLPEAEEIIIEDAGIPLYVGSMALNVGDCFE